MVKSICSIIFMFWLAGCQDFISASKAEWPPLKKAEPEAFKQPIPTHPNGIDVGVVRGDQLWVHYDEIFFHSSDSGRNWSIIKTPEKIAAVGLQVSTDNKTIVLISDNGKLFRSDTAGKSWQVLNLEQSLAANAANSQFEEYGFGINKAIISSDFNNIAIISVCQLFISNDMANSWHNLAPPSSYKKSKRDYCAYDVILDSKFKPRYSLSHMTGSIASDEYVMQYQDQQWSELCSYGISGLLLKSVANCSEVEQADQLTQFYRQSEVYRPELGDDFIDAVFADHHYPLSKEIDLLGLGEGVSSAKPSRSWVIDYRGIAMSQNQGETWQTQVGGLGAYTKSAILNDGTQLALSRGHLYVSQDGLVWQPYKNYPQAEDLHNVAGGALIANNEIVFVKNLDEVEVKQEAEHINKFFAGESLIWAEGSASLFVSKDQGETWLTTKLGEQETSDWICQGHCISMDYYGVRIQSAYLRDDDIDLVAMPAIDSSQDFEINEFWNSSDLQTLIVSAYKGDSDYENFWLSNNGGQDWRQLAIKEDVLGNVVFPQPGLVLASSSNKIYSINADSGKTNSTSLPGDIYAESLCVLPEQQIILDVVGKHPDLAKEESLTFYSEDSGISWFTLEGQSDWFDYCNS